MYSILRDKNWLIQKYEIEKKNSREIAEIIGCGQTTVCAALLKHSIRVRYHVDLFIDHPDVIEGLLLGDGCIRKRGNNHHILSIRQKDKKLVEYLRNILCPKSKIYKHSPATGKIEGRVINRSTNYSVNVSSPVLKPYYEKWYPNGVKVVPKDIQLKPLSLANWFIGDGSTSYQGNSVNLTLATQSFTYEDICFLRDKIQLMTGEMMGLSKRSSLTTSKTLWHLQTNKKSLVKSILDYMGESPVSSMKYKWKYPTFTGNERTSHLSLNYPSPIKVEGLSSGNILSVVEGRTNRN